MSKEENKNVFGLREIVQKLNIMSGVINNIEGIVRNIRSHQKIDSQVLAKIYELIKTPVVTDKTSFYFSKVKIENITIEGRITKIAMNEFQQVSATYTAEKKDGTPAKVQNPRLETDRPDVLTGELDEVGQRVTFKAKKGVVTEDTAVAVKVIADADLGDGVTDIEVVGSVLVSPGQAEKLTLNFEEPVDQTDQV